MTSNKAPHKRASQRRHLEYHTPTKSRLIGASCQALILKDVYEAEEIPSRTARKWRKEYQEHGSPSLRRTKRLGRPSKVLDDQLNDLLGPQKN